MLNDHKSDNRENHEKEEELESKRYKDEKIEKEGQVTLDENEKKHKIHLITIIGEIEGHENAGNQSKVTKYELCCRSLHPLRTAETLTVCCFCLIQWGEMWKRDLP